MRNWTVEPTSFEGSRRRRAVRGQLVERRELCERGGGIKGDQRGVGWKEARRERYWKDPWGIGEVQWSNADTCGSMGWKAVVESGMAAYAD